MDTSPVIVSHGPQHVKQETYRSNRIDTNMIRSQPRRQSLDNIDHRSLGRRITRIMAQRPIKPCNTRRDNNLTLLPDIALPISLIQKLHKRQRRVKCARDIHMHRLRKVLHRHLPQSVHILFQARFAVLWQFVGYAAAADAGIGEDDVDESVFLLDAGGDGGERGFGGHVADYGDDGAIGTLCCSRFERPFAASKDVDGFGAVGVESFGHLWPHVTNRRIGRTSVTPYH